MAAKSRQEADAANSDARMTVIPQEIREAEDKIAALKGQIEDDQRLVTEMRKHEDELREVQMLKRQVENEREVTRKCSRKRTRPCTSIRSTQPLAKIMARQISFTVPSKKRQTLSIAPLCSKRTSWMLPKES